MGKFPPSSPPSDRFTLAPNKPNAKCAEQTQRSSRRTNPMTVAPNKPNAKCAEQTQWPSRRTNPIILGSDFCSPLSVRRLREFSSTLHSFLAGFLVVCGVDIGALISVPRA